jgi:osmotically-inducible protein OsmY
MKRVTAGIRAFRALFSGLAVTCALTATGAGAMAADVTDQDITNAAEADFWADTSVPSNRIDVTTSDGIVTLSGEVGNILAKDRAAAIVAGLNGVRAVVNRIKVKPTPQRSDADLARAVKDALLADPAADSYEVGVSAADGAVTLTGTVDSYAEKQICETVAKGVKGVVDVKNNIDINYKTTRPDLEIKTEIAERLENDIRVDDYLIDVEVNKGNVTLTGTVGSLQEKQLATTDAWVAGVNSVDNTGLDIEWWERDSMRRKTIFVTRTDDQIEKAVNDALMYDPRVYSYNPDVQVDEGTVTLTGIVEDKRAKRAAEQDARNTVGVWRVKNNLKVRPTIPANDELEQRVADALLEDPYVERFDINVEAYAGWVYLSGKVNTTFEKNRAQEVAEKVKGVVDVVNNIDYSHVWIWKPDWEVKADVEDQLESSAFVDEKDITVSVDDGVVTLSGTVDSWSESTDAEKNAYQGGAKDVINLLTVTYQHYGPYGPGYYGPGYYGPGYYGPNGPGYLYSEP